MKEQLMIPRVEVTNWYPYSQFNVGDVLTMYRHKLGYDYYKNGKHQIGAEQVEKATANFRSLKWYERRELSEMPEYVKIVDKNFIWDNALCVGSIHKVINWDAPVGKMKSCYLEPHRINELQFNRFSPATLEEYNTYIELLKNSK